MTNIIAVNGVLLVLLTLAGLVPVLIGVYVYKDAKSRHMDAVLWTIIAILVPSFVGLIIYLVIRSNNNNLNCPSCHNPIAAEYVLCPYCGLPLKATCPTCETAVYSDWKVCPKCGAELPLSTDPAALYPKPKNDRKLILILLAAIVIPLTILAFAMVGISSFSSSSASFQMSGELPVGYKEGAVFPAVAEWVERCDENGQGIYVLEFSPQIAHEFYDFVSMPDSFPKTDKEDIFAVVLYISRDQGEIFGNRYISQGGVFECHGKTLDISYETTAIPSDDFTNYQFSYAIFISDNNTINKVRLLIDGRDVEYNLSVAN